MKNVVLDEKTVKYSGRVFNDGQKLWLTQSASGCEFTFSGKKLDIILNCDNDSVKEDYYRNKPRIEITVNGRIRIKKVIKGWNERYTLISSETPVTAKIGIIKLSEAAFSLCSAEAETDEDAVIVPVPALPKRIEFIGDSITCGYGVDDSNIESEFSTEAENAAKSYAYLCSQLLGTEYSLFAYSGYGVISGWTLTGSRNDREILPPYYEKLTRSYKTADGILLDDIPWDFTSQPNDIVVLNIGTNDNSYCIRNKDAYEEFETAYADLLRTVHRCNPDAAIISTIGIMNVTTDESIHKAVQRFTEESGVKVYEFSFTPQDGNLGYGSDYHPSEDTHIYAAEELARFIEDNHILD